MVSVAVPSMTPHSRLDAALALARDYALGRQCANGGFSFYRNDYLEEPSPHDTWHALAALRLLGTSPPREEDIFRFIIDQPVTAQPYALYFRVRSLGLLEAADPEHAAVRAAVAALTTPIPDLASTDDPNDALTHLRLVLWLKRHFGLSFQARGMAQSLLASEHSDGGFGVPPNLIATRLVLAVLVLCEAHPSARTEAFVARMATPGFGFRLTAGPLAPNLEITCAGISCCQRLNLPIAHAADAQAFILDCQTGGGFARAPDALPDLALTHLALAGLEVLAGPLYS